jgi:DNA-binding CsgD family transcriptional regulator
VLGEGLPLDEAALRRLEPIDWNHYATMLNRLEGLVGYEPIEVLCVNIPQIAPQSQALLAGFVSPRMLYEFTNNWLGPMMYPMFKESYEETGDRGLLRVELRDNSLIDCHAHFKAMRAGQSAIPRFIGYPGTAVRAETSPRGGTYWIELPPSETLVSRAVRGVRAMFDESALLELERDKARLKEANEQLWRGQTLVLEQRLNMAERRWALTPRQKDILSGLARGLSNKELGTELGCSHKTIEGHVHELLKRAGTDSRLGLVAAFWRSL